MQEGVDYAPMIDPTDKRTITWEPGMTLDQVKRDLFLSCYERLKHLQVVADALHVSVRSTRNWARKFGVGERRKRR